MFPYGTDGWHQTMLYGNVTQLQFYKHRLQVRHDTYNIVMRSKRLMQQYVVDMWAKIEGSRMNWITHNQRIVRAEKYNGLYDALDNELGQQQGRKFILPPSVYGSPRWYREAFQNAMTLVRTLGKPDIFVTFTTNPNWPEMKEALLPGESPSDRPDICDRVFNLKFQSLLDD